ncbi:MAG: M42 family peptidase [Verrucomicrobia bacterium]|jgi:tetrahedral aminopeptidase|nr:M42 family peptidase [Verrucomicrobiota bacterium]MBT7065346.1 M42 family peptidase [Verrucomicrobiota bacterium]MBT7699028.1 M42 family peptidase [Verrucomicrobiota bacterium]
MNSKLLKRICNAPGVSGFEDAAQAIATEVLSECCDEVKRDHMGNVIALKKATNPPRGRKKPLKLMIAAHADEVGMLVTNIDGKGMLQFRQMGGLGSEVAQSQRVIIHSRKPIRGAIVPKGGSDGKTAPLGDLVIDTGMPKEQVEKLVNLGDVATFENDASVLNGKMWVGRNFDDRIGSYCLLAAMQKIEKTSVDVYAVSSVQEEVGLRGARAAAGGIAPDIGIAIDGSMSRGAYSNGGNLCEPGQGTGIYMVDKLTIGHPKLVKYLFKMCAKHKIPHQLNIGGGTDAAAIQQSPGGVIATTVGAPVRYMHSTVQLCHADDMDATVALLVKFMETAHTFYNGLDYVTA